MLLESSSSNAEIAPFLASLGGSKRITRFAPKGKDFLLEIFTFGSEEKNEMTCFIFSERTKGRISKKGARRICAVPPDETVCSYFV